MSKKNKNKRTKKQPKIHNRKLVDSSHDTVALCRAVEDKFKDLCGSHLRVRGVKLIPPEDLREDLLLWRAMRIRHLAGDFRNTRDEELATRRVAQWTLNVNDELRNQNPKPPIEWAD